MTKKSHSTNITTAGFISNFFEKLSEKITRIERRHPQSSKKAALKIAFWCIKTLFKKEQKKQITIDTSQDLVKTDIKYEKNILIVNTDSIGDYILWRNFIHEIKTSTKYKDYVIHVIANNTFKKFIEYLDSEYIEKIFFAPPYIQNLTHEKLIELKEEISNSEIVKKYHTVIYNSLNSIANNKKFLAEQFITSDIISKYSIINCESALQYNPIDLLKFTYVHRRPKDEHEFEFSRNKPFYEEIIENRIKLKYPIIESEKVQFGNGISFIKDRERDYVIINPCAYDRFRCWHRRNWADLIEFIYHELHLDVYIICGSSEHEYCTAIKEICAIDVPILPGMELHDMFALLKCAALYIGEDSGIFHVAAALDIRCIALSSGSAYFRFMNYPKSRKNISIIFPEGVEQWIYENQHNQSINVRDIRNYSINSITLNQVRKQIRKLLNIKEIYFITKMKTKNIGDRNICVLDYFQDYFSQYICKRFDIDDLPFLLSVKSKNLIFGGGGMIDQNDNWNNWISLLSKTNNVILWSTGMNLHYDTNKPKNLNINRISLLGLRDYLISDKPFQYQYVPCVSCLLNLFDNKYREKRKIGVITHLETDKNLFKDYDRILNDNNQTLEDYIQFIGESEFIITNTYHGMYWATLMGKKVILYEPFSNKFDNFKYKPRLYSGNLNEDMRHAKAYPNAKEECRKINLDFFSDVKKVLEK